MNTFTFGTARSVSRILFLKSAYSALVFVLSVLSVGRGHAKSTSASDIDLASNSNVTVSGKLNQGKPVDLKWASNSNVACFPATQNQQFSGSHVLYRVQLPKYSTLEIELLPKKKDLDVSLYAYTVRAGDKNTLPPNIPMVVSCEASAGSKNYKRRDNPGATERVQLNATTNAYTAYIGVAGTKKTKSGDFKLKLNLRTAAAEPQGKVKRAKDVKLKENGVVKLRGKLNGGTEIGLSWAAKSSVACFPATRSEHYNGAHQLYRVELPRFSVLKIKATPKRKNLDVSLYAYSVGAGDKKTLPPNVSGVVSCEASAGSKSRSRPFNPGQAESVRLNATTNNYTAYVGVTGAKGVKAGDFDLEFDLQVRPAEVTGAVQAATELSLKIGEKVTKSGKIDGGTEIPLSWAANSSVACFPTTRSEHFNGSHVVYSVPLPSYSELTVKLIPADPKLDLSLYAYSVGPQYKNTLPPNVHSVVSCEASSGAKNIRAPYNPGATEQVSLMALRNPYHVIVGVAGAQKVKAGSFKLEFSLKKR